MLLGRGDTKAFREQRRSGTKRDGVRQSVNKGITAMEERENYSSLQEFTEEPTPGANRLVLQHNDGILSVYVTKISRDFMCVRASGETATRQYCDMLVLYLVTPYIKGLVKSVS